MKTDIDQSIQKFKELTAHLELDGVLFAGVGNDECAERVACIMGDDVSINDVKAILIELLTSQAMAPYAENILADVITVLQSSGEIELNFGRVSAGDG